MTGWTRRPQHFFQHLLREVDAIGLDPAALVAEVAQMGASGTICMGGGFSAWYPTDIAAQPRNPHLQGDVLGCVVAAAGRAGLRVLARMDISKGRPELAARHPDWFVRRPDGSLATVWAMPQICATGPFWREQNPAILEEVLGRYPVDGFFYNYLHVPRCWCDRCRRLVREATGEEVPPPGTRSPAHERWRRRVLADAVGDMAALIHARRPEAVLVPYHHLRDGWDMRAMAAASGLISAQISNPELPNPVDPQPIWTHWAAEEALLARAVKPDAAPLLIQTASNFFASRQTAMPRARMLRNMAQAAAHGGGTCPAVNGRIAGQEDSRVVPAMAAFGAWRARTADWYGNLRPLARIALIRSEDSVLWGADAGRPAGDPAGEGHLAEYRGCYEALTQLRHPLDILPAGGLTVEALAGYALVVLPGVTCLSDADAAALDGFVAAGGALLVTGEAGACDEDGRSRDGPALRCLPALPGESRNVSGAYFALSATPLRQAFENAPWIGAAGRFWSPDLPLAEADLRLIGPFTNNAPEFTHVEGPGTTPGLLRLGRVCWLPWQPGALFHRHAIADFRALLGAVVEDLAGPPPLRSTAPGAVEMVLYGHPRGVLLHLINNAVTQGAPGLFEVAPLAGFTIRLPWPVEEAIRLDEAAPPLALSREGGETVLHLERLDGFAAIALLSDIATKERASP